MIHFIAYFLIVILISMLLFNRTAGFYKYIILGIFATLFGIIFLNSNYYLDLPISGSITLIYFLFIILMGVIRISYVNYVIIILIVLSFLTHIFYDPIAAQGIINFAFYSIIILVIRLILDRQRQ